MIRTLIADDEPLAREGIRARLVDKADFDVVGEASDGLEVIDAVTAMTPDLLFLDVQMPGIDGFDALGRLPPASMPAVVLVTAYDRYAVKAFEARALDFLLKPIDTARFGEVLDRVRHSLATPSAEPRGGLAPPMPHPPLTRFPVKDRDHFILLKPEEVDWVHSAGNYAELHARGRTFLVRMTMGELEVRLDPGRFVRIHRSTIVNLDRIAEIHAQDHGEFQVLIEDGTRLRLSRRYRDRLLP
ncbi:MAG: LytR/AlgR family response regulator transcription factor [Vicinamibacterales bacterium]